MVEVAGGHVDADVAGTAVACVVERCVVGAGVVPGGVAVALLSRAGDSDRGAEDEAFVSRGKGGGVVLLVAVTGCNVGAHVAVGVVQGVIDSSFVPGVPIQYAAAAAFLRIQHGGPGTCCYPHDLFQRWAFGLMVVALSIALLVIFKTAGLCCECHHSCQSESQRFESRCRVHGVSPCSFVCQVLVLP
ncbi:hypothetical protein D3C78_895540 [compost metagenome]